MTTKTSVVKTTTTTPLYLPQSLSLVNERRYLQVLLCEPSNPSVKLSSLPLLSPVPRWSNWRLHTSKVIPDWPWTTEESSADNTRAKQECLIIAILNWIELYRIVYCVLYCFVDNIMPSMIGWCDLVYVYEWGLFRWCACKEIVMIEFMNRYYSQCKSGARRCFHSIPAWTVASTHLMLNGSNSDLFRAPPSWWLAHLQAQITTAGLSDQIQFSQKSWSIARASALTSINLGFLSLTVAGPRL